MQKLFVSFLALLFSLNISAQLLDSIYKYQKKGISFNHQNIFQPHFYVDDFVNSNANIKYPERRTVPLSLDGRFIHNFNANFLFFTYRSNTTTKLGKYIKYENRGFSDFLNSVYLKRFVSEGDYRDNLIWRGIITSGILGEFYYGRNVLVNFQKTFILSVGAQLGDMYMPNTYFGLQGYHLFGGGFANMDWVIGKTLVWRLSPSIAGHFAQLTSHTDQEVGAFRIVEVESELIYENGWFMGYEYIQYDRRSARKSMKIGYRFNKIGSK